MTVLADPPWLHPEQGAVRVEIIVSPRASRTRIMGVHGDRLKVQLAAPPADGQANAALVRFLADTLEVAKAQVEIVAGATSKRKSVRLSGVSAHRALMKLTPPGG